MLVVCNRTYIYEGQIIRSGDDVSPQAVEAIKAKEKRFAERLKKGTTRKLLNQDSALPEDTGDVGLVKTHTEIPENFTARQVLLDAGFSSIEQLEALETAALLRVKGLSQADAISIAKQLGKVS